MQPMTDLCWQCQKNSAVIVCSSNCSEEEKSSTIKIAEEHLRIVQMERSYYTSSCEDSSRFVRSTMLRTIVLLLLSLHHEFLPTQSPSQVYYSFHYAQQVHFPSDPLQPDPIYFPSDPLQPDPIYFLTTRKFSVFGVCYKAIPRQINFITDESGETGKGANAVISRLRFFYENHGLGEKDVIFMLTTVLARTRTI